MDSKLNMLCLVCSGKASDYFNKTTGKFMIKKNYCTSLVSSCSQTMDVFSKVSHLFEVVRVVKSAATSTKVSSLDNLFTQTRLLAFEECAANPNSCHQDDAKLDSICREFGFVRDIRLVKANSQKMADSSTVKTEAAGGFESIL